MKIEEQNADEMKSVRDLLEATDLVIKILEGRKGFGHWWDSIDEEHQDEIRTEIDAMLKSKMGSEPVAVDCVTVPPPKPKECPTLGEGWRLLIEGESIQAGDGFWHPEYDFWTDYDCRPDLFRGDGEFAHTWPWRRKI